MEKEIVYEGGEDTYFLLECIEKEIGSRKIESAIEIGTGSGIISIALSPKIGKIIAIDINPDALKRAKKEALEKGAKNIEFAESDLFEKVAGKFDLVFFNPPYLPGKGEKCLCGGKNGQEVTERFLQNVGNHLENTGEAIVLLSSFNQVEMLKKKYGLEIIAEKKLWFESLWCAKLSSKHPKLRLS
ncbi:MAG: methyltransferase [Candidatus Aenigmarchaeota archaeon]|nr:methyltransferase [Candidatus Aenigmarchaeota archaeon]